MTRLPVRFFVFIAGLLLLRTTGVAQSGNDLIYLHHADSLVGMEINGERARQVIGHVRFSHGKTIVTCRRAIQYLQSNKVTLEGDVEVNEDSLTMLSQFGTYYGNTRVAEATGRVRLDDNKMVLYADYGTYYSAERKAHFWQNVMLLDSTSVLTADILTYYRDEQKSIAESNVVIVNRENHITIMGGHFENYRKVNYSLMLDRPRAVHTDTTGGTTDSLVILSDTLETYQKTPQRMIATGHVRMNRSDVTSEAGSGIFYTKLDSMELRQSPFVWQTQSNGITTQISGDSIFVKIEQKKLRNVFVHGHAFSVSEADSIIKNRYHQTSGQSMTMTFNKNKIDTILVDRNATILYFLFDDKTPNGLNTTTGDHVTISFTEGKIERLKVTGGVEGKYVPERMIIGKEAEYNLIGFNWKPKPVVR